VLSWMFGFYLSEFLLRVLSFVAYRLTEGEIDMKNVSIKVRIQGLRDDIVVRTEASPVPVE
jgi:hypothetical protein